MSIEQRIEMIKSYLARGADINARDNEGRTPLMCACISGLYEIVELLLENGAGVDIPDNKGRTPLMLTRDLKIGKLLIEKGADVNARSLYHIRWRKIVE